jgi:DNA-binding LytR/AlgR family response regulator
MKCLAIDDEPLALELIEDFCSRVKYLELVSTSTSAIEAIELLNIHTLDLIFVDINMPRISGLELVKSLSKPPIVIFTTAYSQYAATGYDLDAIDYLVKPISFDRFLKAVNKAKEIHEARYNKPAHPSPNKRTSEKPTILILKVEYSTVKIELKDILYIESVKDYAKVVVRGRTKSYFSRISLKAIMEKLPHDNFCRIHKSYIIALSALEKIENNRIIIGEKYIPIGGFYKKDFYTFLESM